MPETCLPVVYIHDTRGAIEVDDSITRTDMSSTPTFTKELRLAGHVRRFTIKESSGEGWELREEQDSELVRQIQYRDWHRVERARMRIDAEVCDLRDRGWTESGSTG
jgi:hypothetical protein